MLTILFLLTTIMSLGLLSLRRDRRGLLLFLSSASLLVFYLSVLTYIAKKGGISNTTSFILYGFRGFRRRLQYQVLTLQTLGFTMAVSKFLFPYFLLLASQSLVYLKERFTFLEKALAAAVIPLLSIVLYLPSVFERLTGNTTLLSLVVHTSRVWSALYILLAIYLMVREYFSIRFAFYRRRALVKLTMILSLGLLYSFFLPQDPAQVYLFYRNEYMGTMGLWYLQRGFTSGLYYVVMLGSVFLSLAGIISFLRYFYATFGEVTEVRFSRKRNKTAMKGVSMFVHGTKNDLLATQILLSTLASRYPEDQEVQKLQDINGGLRIRLDQLNRASKINSISLKPQPLEPILKDALDRLNTPLAKLDMEDSSMLVLADKLFLSEALANIIQNGIEANKANGSDKPVEVKAFHDRLWTVITVEDDGKGISKEVGKHLWEPFYTSKNSSTNWGIGMYYTKSIVRNHLGSINYESMAGGGTRFSITLPKVGGKDTWQES